MAEHISKFWEEVAQGYRQVVANHAIRVTVERDGKKADIEFIPLPKGEEYVAIDITDAPPQHREALITPP